MNDSGIQDVFCWDLHSYEHKLALNLIQNNIKPLFRNTGSRALLGDTRKDNPTDREGNKKSYTAD